MYAIVWCKELQISWPDMKEKALDSAAGFSSIRANHVMTECVAVLDGYHMAIATAQRKKSTMPSSTSLVTTRHMASTYRWLVTTIVISCLLGWVGLA